MMQWSSHSFGVAAEEYGFIVIYPNGYKRYWNDCRRNAGYPANRENIDDIGFLRALVDEMERIHGSSGADVLVVGISNGGHMAYRLAYEAQIAQTDHAGVRGTAVFTTASRPRSSVNAP